MDPVTGALIVGGAGLIGGMISNSQNASNARDATQTNLQSAREQMAFQERMSNSAYQRSMADMQKAGLNPMLAYQQGGASTPSGASGQAQKADYTDPLGPAMSSAIHTKISGETLANAQAQTTISQANSIAQIKVQQAQALQIAQSAKSEAIKTELLQQSVDKSKTESEFYKSPAGKTLYNIDKFSDSIGGLLDNIFSAKRIFKREQNREEYGRYNKKTGEIFP